MFITSIFTKIKKDIRNSSIQNMETIATNPNHGQWIGHIPVMKFGIILIILRTAERL